MCTYVSLLFAFNDGRQSPHGTEQGRRGGSWNVLELWPPSRAAEVRISWTNLFRKVGIVSPFKSVAMLDSISAEYVKRTSAFSIKARAFLAVGLEFVAPKPDSDINSVVKYC